MGISLMSYRPSHILEDTSLVVRTAQLKRQPDRTWVVVGSCQDIPVGCRPYKIYPIVGVPDEKNPGMIKKTPRMHARGWIDMKEQYAYVRWRDFHKEPDEQACAKDEVQIVLNKAVE